MPRATASRTDRTRAGWPSTVTLPASAGFSPNKESASSVRPEPSSPVRPTISPGAKVKETSAKLSRLHNPRTSSRGVPWLETPLPGGVWESSSPLM